MSRPPLCIKSLTCMSIITTSLDVCSAVQLGVSVSPSIISSLANDERMFLRES